MLDKITSLCTWGRSFGYLVGDLQYIRLWDCAWHATNREWQPWNRWCPPYQHLAPKVMSRASLILLQLWPLSLCHATPGERVQGQFFAHFSMNECWMLFLPFSYGQLAMTKPLKGPKEPKVGNAKGLNFLRSHPRVWKINITHTMHLTSLQRRLKTKIQVKNHSKKRETWLPRIMIINKSRFFENLVWRGLDRMIMTYFSTQDFRITKLQWHFRTLLNLALSLWCRRTQHAKKWKKAPQTILIHFLFCKDKRNKEIEREK